MTSQEKHYIEPKDIRGLRCDCECGVSLSVPLEEDLAKALLSCPKCRKRWAGEQTSNHFSAIHRFERALAGLKAEFPFRLYLEIAPYPARCDKDASAAAEKGKK